MKSKVIPKKPWSSSYRTRWMYQTAADFFLDTRKGNNFLNRGDSERRFNCQCNPSLGIAIGFAILLDRLLDYKKISKPAQDGEKGAEAGFCHYTANIVCLLVLFAVLVKICIHLSTPIGSTKSQFRSQRRK